MERHLQLLRQHTGNPVRDAGLQQLQAGTAQPGERPAAPNTLQQSVTGVKCVCVMFAAFSIHPIHPTTNDCQCFPCPALLLTRCLPVVTEPCWTSAQCRCAHGACMGKKKGAACGLKAHYCTQQLQATRLCHSRRPCVNDRVLRATVCSCTSAHHVVTSSGPWTARAGSTLKGALSPCVLLLSCQCRSCFTAGSCSCLPWRC